MRKNISGQIVAFQAINSTDGSDVTTGSPVVYYTIDGGTQAQTTASAVHEGHGQWTVALTQAETNGDHIAFSFVLSGAISQTINVYTINADITNLDAAITTRSTFNSASDTVANVTTVGSVTGAVGSVTGNVGGSVNSVVGDVGGNVVGSVASVSGAVGSVTGNVGGNVVGSVGSVAGNVAGSVASVTGSVGSVTGNVSGSVASVTGAVGSVTGNVGGSVGSVVAEVTTDSASRTASKATLADLSGVALASAQLASSDVSDAVWNVAVSSYNNAGTFGRGFKQVKEGLISDDGQATANGTTTSFVSNLSSAVDDFYNEKTIVFTSGALTGQSRIISDYNGTTKTITVDTREPFTSAVQSGDEFILLAIHSHTMSEIVHSIWVEPQTNFASDTGSFGFYLDAAVSTSGGGGTVTVSDITQAALAKFVTTDTGETVAASGSVAEISQGSAGGNVTVGAFTQAALAEFASVDTGETDVAGGSVCSLSGGFVINESATVAASDVRSGVPFGSFTGTLVVPSVEDVEIGVQYGASGTEYTGTLTALPTTNSIPAVNNGNAKNIVAGNTYRDGFGDVATWDWLSGSFPAYAAGATATLVCSLRNRPSDRTEISLTIDDSGSPVVLKLELTPEQSRQLVSGQYRYDVKIVWSNGDTKTMVFGDLNVYEPYSLQ
jgi:hypothetical protein